MNRSLNARVLKLYGMLAGRQILDRIDDLNRTQWLSVSDLQTIQRAKLKSVLAYAYQYVPYYRRLFDEVGFRCEDLDHGLECLTKIPVLTKAMIRENGDDMLTTEPERRRRLSKLSTSGSTGHPLVFMQDSEFRDMVTADIQRHIGWAGCNLGDSKAFIWGASAQTSLWRTTRTKLMDRVWNRFLTDAFVMTDQTMTEFAKRIVREKPKVLFGYATALHHFAKFVQNSPYQGIAFNGIISTSEILLPPVRMFIEEVFNCKVFDRYGTLELGGIACECEAHTGLHISMENNYVEILQDGSPVRPGEAGEIIVTNLNNLGMPFIRYSIGDAGTWYVGEDCPCGRRSAMLKVVEGRLVDFFYTRDGRKVWPGFAGAGFRCLANPAIRQFQIVQRSLDQMIVRLVPDGEIPQVILEEISHAIQTVFGSNVSVEFEFMEKIPVLPSGKHQYAVSEMNMTKLS